MHQKKSESPTTKQQQQTGKHLCTFQKNAKYYIYNDSSTHIKVGLIIVIP